MDRRKRARCSVLTEIGTAESVVESRTRSEHRGEVLQGLRSLPRAQHEERRKQDPELHGALEDEIGNQFHRTDFRFDPLVVQDVHSNDLEIWAQKAKEDLLDSESAPYAQNNPGRLKESADIRNKPN